MKACGFFSTADISIVLSALSAAFNARSTKGPLPAPTTATTLFQISEILEKTTWAYRLADLAAQVRWPFRSCHISLDPFRKSHKLHSPSLLLMAATVFGDSLDIPLQIPRVSWVEEEYHAAISDT
jgi:hypothetical protein